MKKSTWFHLALSLSLFTSNSLPVAAQTFAQDCCSSTSSQLQTTTIPANSAIIVAFPNNVDFDAGGEQNLPVTLYLVEPIYDNQGNAVIPSNTRVMAALVPREGGAQIVAEALVIGGRVVPIRASSPVIPGRKVTVKSRLDRATEMGAAASRISPFAVGLAGEVNSNNMIKTTLLSQGVGALIGFLSPQSVLVANLPQNSEYILSLEETITLNQLSPITESSAVATEYNFQFQNAAEYSEGLKLTLQAYQEEKISATQAQEIIIAADEYARTQVNPLLYPTQEVRQEIAELFGFTYPIDEVLK